MIGRKLAVVSLGRIQTYTFPAEIWRKIKKKLAVFETPEHLLLGCIPLDAERQEDYQA